MHPAIEVLILTGIFFGYGLARGSVICATICAPAFATRAVDKGFTVRQGVVAAIYFNIPRIAILTILGIIIGYIAYSLSDTVEDNVAIYEDATRWLRMFGYLALGIIVLILGFRMLARNLDEMEDIKEGKLKNVKHPASCRDCQECRESAGELLEKAEGSSASSVGDTGTVGENNSNPGEVDDGTGSSIGDDTGKSGGVKGFREFMRELDPKDRKLFFFSGGMLGLACTSELFIGTMFTGGGLGILQDSPLAAAAVAGAIMFAFSIGASIPVIAVMAAAVKAANMSSSVESLNRIKIAGSAIAVLMGLFLILASLA